MLNALYPLRFYPIFQYRLWGGSKLKDILGKMISQEHIGESWELSDVTGQPSVVANGVLAEKNIKDLIERYQGRLVGEKVYKKFGSKFPLLIKFIDARKPLSIQVHPNDELAKKRHDSFGKNEIWYIIQADQGAELTIGFNQYVTREQYLRWSKTGEIEKHLNKIPVQKGQIYYLPAGRIHAIGAGILIAEIQQTSDVTYRIHDYNRVDRNSRPRELHTALAADAIEFSFHETYQEKYDTSENRFSEVLNTPHFRTKILSIRGRIKKDYSHQDCFTILIAVEGNVMVKTSTGGEKIKAGETLLLPACTNDTLFESLLGGLLLEVTL
ncbi:MAG: type I phosphomannose isomerase catalytic subunit [Flavobacteriales bacterium Tduv]